MGQSVWLDFVSRSFVASGELARRVDEDGLAGLTSNPAIFEKAISGSDDYAEAIARFSNDPDAPRARRIFERLAIEDIQHAADVLGRVYAASDGTDGFVSMRSDRTWRATPMPRSPRRAASGGRSTAPT